MTYVHPVRVTLAQAVWQAAAWAMILAVVATWPAWMLAGPEGLAAEAVAGAVVVVVVSCSMAIVVRQARHGAGRLAAAFILAGVAKVIASVAITLGIWALSSISLKMLLMWLCLFYFVVMFGQIRWLTRVLKQCPQ